MLGQRHAQGSSIVCISADAVANMYSPGYWDATKRMLTYL